MVTTVLRRPLRTWWPALLAIALVVLAGGVMVATAPAARAAQLLRQGDVAHVTVVLAATDPADLLAALRALPACR